MERGKGFFIGALQDRDARYILLARKNRLVRPASNSSRELTEMYIESLKKRDIKLWLQTLRWDVITEIKGSERQIFNELCKKITIDNNCMEFLIESVDPDEGIRPVLLNPEFR